MVHCTNCGREMSEMAMSCPNCGHPNEARAGAAAGALSGASYASWGKRVGAALIDGIIIAIPSWILMAILSVGYAKRGRVTIDPDTGRITSVSTGFFAGLIVSLLVILVAGVLYKVLMEGSPRGQTLGKMALGIRVRDAATGGPITYGKAAIRWVVAAVLWAVLYVGGIIDALFPLWDSRKQTIHDKAAGTIVVDA